MPIARAFGEGMESNRDKVDNAEKVVNGEPNIFLEIGGKDILEIVPPRTGSG